MPRVAILFPGQGAQHVGMAAELCQKNAAARAIFDEASQVLGYDLLQVCTEGPAEQLNATDVSQPAIYVASLAALEELKVSHPEILTDCVATAGLSLGEYTALAFAGAIPFREGLQLVQARGRAMQASSDATPSGMVSILGLEAEEVESLVSEARGSTILEVANYLCPGNTVVSGTVAGIDAIVALAEARGLRTVRLTVAGAFHTQIMKPADELLAKALEHITIMPPRIPVWSNVDGQPHTDPAEIRQLLIQQVLMPVQWEKTMRGMLAEGIDRFAEVGPGRVLAGLLKRVQRKTEIVNITV